jgi:tRNA dimethylallyltransferase
MKVIVIVGPTASGKTRLGVEVAHRFGAEIVSADSRQVYRDLDIGTGKDLEEYESVEPPVPYHLIDIVDVEDDYTLFRYQQDCYQVLRQLAGRNGPGGSVPSAVLVGGSGLYVEAVVRDFRIVDVPRDQELRDRLSQLERRDLVAMLHRESPEREAQTDTSNSRRLIRAVEVAAAERSGAVPTSEPPGIDLEFEVYGVAVERTLLKDRIHRRLLERLEEGMIDEVRSLLDRGVSPHRLAALGLEYREVSAHLLGHKDLGQMTGDLERAICGFAKRQQTWFHGMERRGVEIRWIDADDAWAITGHQ